MSKFLTHSTHFDQLVTHYLSGVLITTFVWTGEKLVLKRTFNIVYGLYKKKKKNHCGL